VYLIRVPSLNVNANKVRFLPGKFRNVADGCLAMLRIGASDPRTLFPFFVMVLKEFMFVSDICNGFPCDLRVVMALLPSLMLVSKGVWTSLEWKAKNPL